MLISSSSKDLSGFSSAFLDLLRIGASLIVFWGHAYDYWHTAIGYSYNRVDWGHYAVVVFFVLSGYVIAFTTTRNNRGIRRYAEARLSRLYSVLLPTLIITAAIELTVKYIDPALASHYIRGQSFPRYVGSALYLNEIWFFSASPPINGPLWSLSYEFWYYVIFGVYFYNSGTKAWCLTTLVCLIAGIKILLMMPIWLLGSYAYRIKRPLMEEKISWSLVLFFLLVSIILALFLPPLPFALGKAPLFFSGQFVTDLVVGLFIALALWVIPDATGKDVKLNSVAYIVIRKLADLTFPLYVLHVPLLVLYRAFWGTRLLDEKQMWLAFFLVLLTSFILGYFMENSKNWWKHLFNRILKNAAR